MPGTITLQHAVELKAGENSHLQAQILAAVNEHGNPLGTNVYGNEADQGKKVRKKGWTNGGDISACLRTSVGLGEIYQDSTEPHIAISSKHTRPVALAKGRTQLEAAIKAIAGDLNSPFGGFWGFNSPLTGETAEFLHRMFIEGVVAPAYEETAVERLSKRANRFLVETGGLSLKEIDVLPDLQPLALGYFLKQDREVPFDARQEAVVVTANQGNTDINSLGRETVEDITFAGNAAIYLSSNLVFYVHDGAIAGLGDGCGARTVAAKKARDMLEISAYAALSADSDELWDAVLYDTPFTREDFMGVITPPLSLISLSDAFFPKLDGFVEASGIDRPHPEFGQRAVLIKDEPFIPKRNNYDAEYDSGLIPVVVVQPGGSLGDKITLPMAEEYGIKMVFTMTPEVHEKYLGGEKVTGRRFFGHIPMS